MNIENYDYVELSKSMKKNKNLLGLEANDWLV